MNIVQATKKYEKWLSGYLEIDKDALAKKHTEMARDPFRFFRATFYRWVQLYPELCKGLNKAPTVLSVGDLHVENFGTWRDEEGRLVWGINDFDEACELPYPNDLVRLATSAKLAIDLEYLQISFPEACHEILRGYQNTIQQFLDEGKEKVRPIVLAERNEWLSRLAVHQVGDPDDFWNKFQNPEKVREVPEKEVPAPVRKAMVQLLPGDVQELNWLSWNKRDAGLGSLGRRRFVVVAEWQGGRVAREAKALCPSALEWAQGKKGAAIRYEDVLGQAVRCLDPCVRVIRCADLSGAVEDCWFVRRLSADCIKIELDSVPDQREDDLFRAMGRETAHIHIGEGRKAMKKVAGDLEERGEKWLQKAADKMAATMVEEWQEWRDHENSQH